MDVMVPSLGIDRCDAPRFKDVIETLPPLPTSAVTRSWSHVDLVSLFATFAATSFAYSFFGHPLFLAVARQQCSTAPVSVRRLLREAYAAHGPRGLFRGVGVAVSGTVISELVYYLIVEYSKEHLPFHTVEERSLGGGFVADVISGPIFTPFAVVSQVQMVAGSPFTPEHQYRNAVQTTRSLLAVQGWKVLFRGTILTIMVAPITGAWWLVYELLKHRSYNFVAETSRKFDSFLPVRCSNALPRCCTSTTDNLIINCAVGAASSMVMSLLLNPLYVLRLRVQVDSQPVKTRFPAVVLLRNIIHREGFRALFRGLQANLFMGAMGGCVFGITYEGAKQFSDITEHVRS